MNIDIWTNKPYIDEGLPSTALSQADNRERGMGGEGKERTHGKGQEGAARGGSCSPVQSCRVSRVTVRRERSSFSFNP